MERNIVIKLFASILWESHSLAYSPVFTSHYCLYTCWSVFKRFSVNKWFIMQLFVMLFCSQAVGLCASILLTYQSCLYCKMISYNITVSIFSSTMLYYIIIFYSLPSCFGYNLLTSLNCHDQSERWSNYTYTLMFMWLWSQGDWLTTHHFRWRFNPGWIPIQVLPPKIQ